jgi:hypothetical protein
MPWLPDDRSRCPGSARGMRPASIAGMRCGLVTVVLVLVAGCSDPAPPAATVLDPPSTTARAAHLQAIDQELAASSPLRYAPEGGPPEVNVGDVKVAPMAPGSVEALRRAARNQERDAGAPARQGGVAGDDFMPRYRDGQLLRPDPELETGAIAAPVDADFASREL